MHVARRMSLTLCHSTFLRGDSMRNVTLPDLAKVDIEELSLQQPCCALAILLDQGKTIKVCCMQPLSSVA